MPDTATKVPKTAYAVFQNRAAADRAAGELTRRTEVHNSYSLQIHQPGSIDPTALPDSATETQKNTALAIAVGCVAGGAIGGGLGGSGAVMGLSAGLGAGLGALFGALSGMLGGMMAGTRRPKKRLRKLAEELSGEQLLMTIEVEDVGQSSYVQSRVQAQGAVDFGDC